MSLTVIWWTIFFSGIVTYAIRLSMIVLLGRVELPPLLRRALHYVPIAVLSAIALPEMLRPKGAVDLSLGNLRLLAGVVAVLVAWKTRNVVITIVAGMATLWGLQALLH